jgi:hypothetical protein
MMMEKRCEKVHIAWPTSGLAGPFERRNFHPASFLLHQHIKHLSPTTSQAPSSPASDASIILSPSLLLPPSAPSLLAAFARPSSAPPDLGARASHASSRFCRPPASNLINIISSAQIVAGNLHRHLTSAHGDAAVRLRREAQCRAQKIGLPSSFPKHPRSCSVTVPPPAPPRANPPTRDIRSPRRRRRLPHWRRLPNRHRPLEACTRRQRITHPLRMGKMKLNGCRQATC